MKQSPIPCSFGPDFKAGHEKGDGAYKFQGLLGAGEGRGACSEDACAFMQNC